MYMIFQLKICNYCKRTILTNQRAKRGREGQRGTPALAPGHASVAVRAPAHAIEECITSRRAEQAVIISVIHKQISFSLYSDRFSKTKIVTKGVWVYFNRYDL